MPNQLSTYNCRICRQDSYFSYKGAICAICFQKQAYRIETGNGEKDNVRQL